MNKKRNKVKIVILSLLLTLVLLYLAMFISTNSVIEYVERVFNGEVPEAITGTPLGAYNIHRIYGNEYKSSRGVSELKYEYKVSRLFVLHNFFDGYVWIKYEFSIYNKEGRRMAFTRVPIARLTIHRENGEWVITRRVEDP